MKVEKRWDSKSIAFFLTCIIYYEVIIIKGRKVRSNVIN